MSAVIIYIRLIECKEVSAEPNANLVNVVNIISIYCRLKTICETDFSKVIISETKQNPRRYRSRLRGFIIKHNSPVVVSSIVRNPAPNMTLSC